MYTSVMSRIGHKSKILGILATVEWRKGWDVVEPKLVIMMGGWCLRFGLYCSLHKLEQQALLSHGFPTVVTLSLELHGVDGHSV